MNIRLPDDVSYILSIIENAGYEAYVVGGCVRDALLQLEPHDWDITTSAKPHEIKALFSHTIDTGLQHGTVTVRIHHTNYEVTTYRIEEDYTDNRHPTKIAFTNLLSEDLKRRDFTINAMAYNPTVGLIDLFHGTSDLHNHILRCVGDPVTRFEEDALRMLRALRFSAQLNFSIDNDTLQAISQCKELLRNISSERIQVELTKLLTSDYPERLELAYETGVTQIILPEFDKMMQTSQNNPHHKYDVGHHTIEALKLINNHPILRYSILFHDIGKPKCKTTDKKGIDHFYGHPQESVSIAHKIMKRLKFDNHSVSLIERYIQYHDVRLEPNTRTVRKAMAKIGTDIFPSLLLIQKADILAQSEYLRTSKLQKLNEVEAIYNRIIEEQDCLTIKDLAINGKDLMDLGISSGPQIGSTLQALFDLVLEHPKMNSKENLLTYVKQHFL